MKFTAQKSLFVPFGIAALLASATHTALAGENMSPLANNNSAEFLHRAADLRIPASPEPFGGGGGGKQLGGAIDAAGEATGLYTVALRLGVNVAPRTRFVGGMDVTLPRLSLGKGLSTRIDVDAIVSANFGGISTLIPLMFNQIYSKGVVGKTRVYIGAGIGPYFGEITRFGGKLLVGAGITEKLGVELDVYFPGFGDPYVAIMARLPLAF